MSKAYLIISKYILPNPFSLLVQYLPILITLISNKMPKRELKIKPPFLSQNANTQDQSNNEHSKIYIQIIQQSQHQIDKSISIQVQFLQMKKDVSIIKQLNYIVQALGQYKEKQTKNVEIQTTKSKWINQQAYTTNFSQTKRRLYQFYQQLYEPTQLSNLLQSMYKYLHQTYLITSNNYPFKCQQVGEELQEALLEEQNYLLLFLQQFLKEEMA